MENSIIMQPQDLAALIEKVQKGESTEEEELVLLKEIDISYKALIERAEQLKIEQLKGELTA